MNRVVEDLGVHPYVGAVIADGDGQTIATAHRGETGAGRHAEFIALSKARDTKANLHDAELFVTLEPWTARGPGKIPCTQRIKDSGIRACTSDGGIPTPRYSVVARLHFVGTGLPWSDSPASWSASWKNSTRNLLRCTGKRTCH